MTRNYVAGILPITYVDGVPMFLVGEDVRDGSYSDFGGKNERYDRNVIATACREFYEESLGCVLDMKQIRARLNPSTAIMMRGRTQNANTYYMFVVEVPYMPHLRNVFLKMLGFFRVKNIQRMYVEKTNLQWVTLPMLKHIIKRSVFANTLNMHIEAIDEIGTSAPSQWKELCKKYGVGWDGVI